MMKEKPSVTFLNDEPRITDDFDKQKIVWSETNNSKETKVAIDKNKFLCDKTTFICVANSKQELKHIYMQLSSNIFSYYMIKSSPLLGEKGISLTKQTVENFPLLPINKNYNFSLEEITFIENALK